LAAGLGRVTTWTYNAEGQVRDKYDPRGTNILDYLYDANGRLTNRWSKAKGNTRYRYDAVVHPVRSSTIVVVRCR
jgi:uncharacterized protein RhaS with RHS repeats